MDYFDTFVTATFFHRNFTFFTLNEKQVAGLVCAVCMSVARFAALVAMANNIIRNPFATTMVENKIFPDEFILKPQIFHLPRIFNYAALKLKHIFETFVFIVCAGFFATDSARAIH